MKEEKSDANGRVEQAEPDWQELITAKVAKLEEWMKPKKVLPVGPPVMFQFDRRNGGHSVHEWLASMETLIRSNELVS